MTFGGVRVAYLDDYLVGEVAHDQEVAQLEEKNVQRCRKIAQRHGLKNTHSRTRT